MGLETLKGCRDGAKLRWWSKLVKMPGSSQQWNVKPRRGRQKGKVVDVFVLLQM